MRKNLSKGKTVTVYQYGVVFKSENPRTRETHIVEIDTATEALKAIEALQAYIDNQEN